MNEMTDEVLFPKFDKDLDGVQCSMSDIESPSTAKHKTQDVCEKLQKTHAKLKNKNAKLRRSVEDMNRTLSQEKHIVSDLQNRVQCLELELERTFDVNKQLQSDIEKLQKGFEDLGAENMRLKTLLDSLHKSIVEAKGNPITNSCSIKPDTPLHVQHRQIQEIFNIFKEMESAMKNADRQLFNIFSLVVDGLDYKVVTTGRAKRMVYDPPDKENDMYLRTISTLEKMKETQLDIKRLEDENNCLESLMSCLHKHISTGTEANHTLFELPSEIPPDSAVASSYKAAHSIWRKFVKMNSTDKLTKKYTKLIMSVEDMDQALSRRKETVMKLRNRIKMLESDLESKSTVNEQLQARYEKLQKRIDELTADLEQFNTKGKENITKKNNKLLMSVEDMDRSQSRENETVMKLRNREHSLLLELKSTNAVNRQLHDNCQMLQRRIDVLTDDLDMCQINFQIQKDLNKAVDEKWKCDRELLQKTKDSLTMMRIQMANHQQREIQFKAAYDAEVMRTENQQKQIDGLQLKSDDLLNRLGKLAGDRLIHENTNIADLSDANRPTKLAETYSELYDNEWTDAFEELISRNLTDKEAIGKLLEMILMSFHKCREITWERYRSLQSIMSTIDIHVFACVRGFPEGTKTTATQSELSSHKSDNTNVTINLEVSNEEHLVCTTTMSFDQEKEIKRIWRTTTTALRDEAVKHLHSVLLTKFDVSIDAFPKTSKYLAICIDLCWKMGVQERPMHLDAAVETGDSSEKMLDLNKFRPYTNTGKRVAFVVWPALFLLEGGPMLVKGIAQGCNETD